MRNKAEWIEKGEAIVNEFEAKIKRKTSITDDMSKSMSAFSDRSSSSRSATSSSHNRSEKDLVRAAQS